MKSSGFQEVIDLCELLGISSNFATELTTSLGLFARRGSQDADNPDGWGVAYLEDNRFQLQKEPTDASHSERLASLYSNVQSDLVLAHVRKAKHPFVVNSLANTHPFHCSCCGREWVFAHNGLVPDIMGTGATRLNGGCGPEGETDSEYACYYLLEKIAPHFSPNADVGSSVWLQELATVSETVTSFGQFNFLLSNGSYLIAYGHDRLHTLEQRNGDQLLSLVATEPLTANQSWQAFEAGELRVYRHGEMVACLQTQPALSDQPGSDQAGAQPA